VEVDGAPSPTSSPSALLAVQPEALLAALATRLIEELVDSRFRSRIEHLCLIEEASEQRALVAARNEQLAQGLAAARGVKRNRALQAVTNKAKAIAKADPRRSTHRK
jgi:hypothetical protein